MPFHPVAQCTDCQIRMQSGTNLMENGFQFKWSNSTPPSAAELASLALELAGTVGLALRNCVSDQTVFREIYCRNLDEEMANQATYTFPNGTKGTRGGNQVAANEACGIVKRTGLTGRGGHGRNSVSTFPEGDVDGNSVGSTLMGLLGNLALQILLNAVSNRFLPALAHRPRVSLAPGSATLLQSAIVLDNNVDSQKTRLNSHGR